MGDNAFGQLGNGTSSSNPNPTPVCVASNVVAVAAGVYHSLFVTTDGTLWAMGYNYYGQLGNGMSGIFAKTSTLPASVPQLFVANIFPADQAYHSLAIGFIKASATVTLGNLNQTYTGSAISVTASTNATRPDGEPDLQWFSQRADESGQLHRHRHHQRPELLRQHLRTRW